MGRRLLIVAALLVAVAALAAPPVQARNGAADEHRRIVDYWTPARQASAIPRDVSPNPRAKPGAGGGGGTGGGTATVLGASWTLGGSVAKTTGKVFFTLDGVRYVCSASAVAGAPNLVLSAGHCVHHGGGGAFATNWMFVPGYNNGSKPFGEWTATELFTTDLWANVEDGFDDDAGFARVTNGSGGDLATVLGATIPTIDFGAVDTTLVYSAFGYPAAQKYKGQKLIYCQGKVRHRYDGHDTYALPCDMTGGSSGGPWIVGPTSDAPKIRSLNSYGYASVSATMFGPVFGAGEQAAFADAVDGCPTSTALCRKL